jgi:hypothetical protein
MRKILFLAAAAILIVVCIFTLRHGATAKVANTGSSASGNPTINDDRESGKLANRPNTEPANSSSAGGKKVRAGVERRSLMLGVDDRAALADLKAGTNLDEVKNFANELLASDTDPRSWNYGNMVYAGNSLLGRVAIREGKLDEARRYLIEAGRTPGSSQLNSFGPDFALARELLAANEYDTVLEFLELVRLFWANPEHRTDDWGIRLAKENLMQLEAWKSQIAQHQVPEDPKWREPILLR